jgi:hypothetical protein
VSSAPTGERTAYRRAVLQRRSDGIEISLLPPGFHGAATNLFRGWLIVGMTFWGLGLLNVVESPGQNRLQTVVGWGLVLLGCGACVEAVLDFFGKAFSRGWITATGNHLTIRRRELFRTRRWDWTARKSCRWLPEGCGSSIPGADAIFLPSGTGSR